VPTPEGNPREGRPVAGRGPSRLPRAIRALAPEQRIAGGAALALWISMFLPWYGKSVTETVKNSLRAAGYDLSAFGAFSFVEAAVLLVASAVLALLFARAERRAFHLPGGDGLVILAGGIWVSVLIFYRMLDKPGTTGNDRLSTTVGLQWGIFFALAASISLAYAGARVRAAHRPEPALRDDPTVPRRVVPRRVVPSPAATRRSPSRPSDQQATRPSGRPPGPPARPFDAAADAAAADPAFDRGAAPAPRSRFPPPPSPPPPSPERPGAGAGEEPTVDRRSIALPAAEDPPTKVNRRVPRFDDLDAEWISTERLSREADRPTGSDGER
jgi:hypothetical protein